MDEPKTDFDVDLITLKGAGKQLALLVGRFQHAVYTKRMNPTSPASAHWYDERKLDLETYEDYLAGVLAARKAQRNVAE